MSRTLGLTVTGMVGMNQVAPGDCNAQSVLGKSARSLAVPVHDNDQLPLPWIRGRRRRTNSPACAERYNHGGGGSTCGFCTEFIHFIR